MSTATVEDHELEALLYRVRDGDERARELVVEHHLSLVRALASRYAGRGESLDDLIQVGAIGLVLAVSRFDPERGVPFRSYAIPTIVGEIRRHFRDRAWALHVPRRLKELSLRISKTVGQLTAELGRSPTIAEIAAVVEVTEDEVIDALDIANAYSTRSLSDGPFDDGDDEAYVQALAQVDSGFEEVEQIALLDAGFDALEPRLRRIVELRFYDGLTQSEIAAQVGISQMHVSRLLRQALEIMHRQLTTTPESAE
ncbi:MAG: SigB/SigF/SigG family RNA polymerase sigma factor [Gaiella sp.]